MSVVSFVSVIIYNWALESLNKLVKSDVRSSEHSLKLLTLSKQIVKLLADLRILGTIILIQKQDGEILGYYAGG